MSHFKVVMNGVRLKDKRLSDSAGSHTVFALSFCVLASVLKSMCDVYVRVCAGLPGVHHVFYGVYVFADTQASPAVTSAPLFLFATVP